MNLPFAPTDAAEQSADRNDITAGLALAVGNAVCAWWKEHGFPPALLESDTGDVLLLSGQCVASHMGDTWRVGNWFPYAEINVMRKVTEPMAIRPWFRDMQMSLAAANAAEAAIRRAAHQ